MSKKGKTVSIRCANYEPPRPPTFHISRSFSFFSLKVYLPKWPESNTTAPVDGGRVEMVVEHSNCAAITFALVNGVEATNLNSTAGNDLMFFDWARLQQDNADQAHLAGSRVWISFHSRNTDWLPGFGTVRPRKDII